MILIPAVLLGATLGWIRAARLGGKRADKIQYAAAHGILFAILGLFATVLYHRMT